ncbi:hypothetical protein N9H19_03135, partial [Flavobacteriales bacterium]|nr:hypothetical protein [Flavobacteriales bacterium]
MIQRGGNGRVALVEFNSIPMRFKEQVVVVYGQPFSEQQLFKNKIQPDPEAVTYYSTYKLDDGRSLPNDKQLEYRANAEILNTVKELLSKRRSKRNALGGKLSGAWPKICQVIAELNTNEIPHSLPQNERRLRDRYNAYIKGSYSALIHKGYSNSNSRKVGAKLERLLLSIYCLPNKIYTNNVLELYMQFLGGSIDIADVNTGELFNRHDFFQNGVPIYISEATVWNYLRD